MKKRQAKSQVFIFDMVVQSKPAPPIMPSTFERSIAVEHDSERQARIEAILSQHDDGLTVLRIELRGKKRASK